MNSLSRLKIWLIVQLGGVPRTAADAPDPHRIIARLWEDGYFDEARKMAEACYPTDEAKAQEANGFLVAIAAQDRALQAMKEVAVAALSRNPSPPVSQAPLIPSIPNVVQVRSAPELAAKMQEPFRPDPSKTLHKFSDTNGTSHPEMDVFRS